MKPAKPSSSMGCVQLALVGLALLWASCASAWSLFLTSGPRQIFMYVGTTTFVSDGLKDTSSGYYLTTVSNNATVDTMTVEVPASRIGTGPIAFTPSSTNSLRSAFGMTICSSSSIQIGAGYRRNSSSAPSTAIVTLTAPTQLTTSSGASLPITDISWSTGASVQQPWNWLRSGTLVGNVAQTLVSVPANQLLEDCFRFSYANAVLRPAGTYEGTATFTAYTP